MKFLISILRTFEFLLGLSLMILFAFSSIWLIDIMFQNTLLGVLLKAIFFIVSLVAIMSVLTAAIRKRRPYADIYVSVKMRVITWLGAIAVIIFVMYAVFEVDVLERFLQWAEIN